MSTASLLVLVILAASAVSLDAAKAEACCFPDTWEGGHTEYVPRGNGFISDFYIRTNMSFDLPNKRLAGKAFVKFGKKRFHMKAIVDWAAQKRYYIYKLKNKEVCRVHPIKKPLPPNYNCFLKAFTPLGSYRLGVGENSLNIDSYGFFTENFQNVMTVAPGCIPVDDYVFYKFKFFNMPRDLFCTSSFYDIVPGIKNASVFDVPAVCSKSESYNLMNHLAAYESAPMDFLSTMRNNIVEKMKKSEASRYTNLMESLQNDSPQMEMRSIHSRMIDLINQAVEHASDLQLDDKFMSQHFFTQL